MIQSYDLEYYDPIADRRYRVITKPMTVRDGRSCDRGLADITNRDIEDNYELLSLIKFPALKFGTHLLEVKENASQDNAEWEPFVLTEDTFLDLTEAFILEWFESVMEKNTHRDMSYENLKKFLEATSPVNNETTLTTLPQNGKVAD